MSGWNRPEENTLGVILGRRRRGGVAPGASARAVVRATARGANLGVAHVGIGAGVLCAIQAVYGIALFATHIDAYPSLTPIVLAWLVFVAAFAIMSLTIATRGDRVPWWLFVAYYAALAVVAALDFIAIWPLGNVGAFATASVTAGYGLLPAVTLRPARELVIAAMVLLVSFVTVTALSTEFSPEGLPTQIQTISLAVFPPLFAMFVVYRFRRMVQLELDRVLVQSTVSAPRFAVGMLASEELARLDLAAEELLESVASGRTALPLRPKTASTAAQLATELRLHLIEGRRETWLYHAITESEQLGKAATLKDPGSLAGLLDSKQRDGLLAAVWLLVVDTKKPDAKKPATAADVVLGPIVPLPETAARKTITVPIVISTTDLNRNHVDPSIWDALEKVGRYTSSLERSSLRVDIECVVANPADQ